MTSAGSFASTSTSSPPTRACSSWPSGRVGSSPSRPPSGATGCGSCRCASFDPGNRPAASAGSCSRRSCRRRTRMSSWPPRSTAPSRSRTACTAGSGSCPRLPLLSISGYVTNPEVLPDLPGRNRGRAVRDDRCRASGWTGPRRADRRGERRSIASCSASSIPRTIASCGRRAATATSIATRSGPPSATATRGRPAGSDPSPSAMRPSSRRRSATSCGRFRRAAPRRSGFRGPPDRPSSCSSVPACASRTSRSCSAGAGRLPTSSATCRSRRGCSRSPASGQAPREGGSLRAWLPRTRPLPEPPRVRSVSNPPPT